MLLVSVPLLLVLRLAAGPVDVGGLAHRLAPKMVAGERLDFARLRLSWPVRARGLSAPLVVRIDRLTLTARSGARDVDAGRLDLAVAAGPLLHGSLRLVAARLDTTSVALLRDAGGRVRLAHAPDVAGNGPTLDLDRLRGASLSRVRIGLHDASSGADVALLLDQAAVRPDRGLVAGKLAAHLLVAGQRLAVDASGDASGWRLRSDALMPSSLAGLLPVLSAAAVTLTPTLDIEFDAASGRWQRVLFAADVGAGTLLAGGGQVPVAGGHLAVEAVHDGAGMALRLQPSTLALRPAAGSGDPAPDFTLAGRLRLDRLSRPARLEGAVRIDSARIGFAGIDRYWPAGLAAGARAWIVGNVTDGVATGLHVESDMSGDNGFASLVETGRSGGFDAHGLVLWWLRPMPPLQDLRLHLTFDGPDRVRIDTSHAILPVTAVGPAAAAILSGRVPQPLALSVGTMTIDGLAGDRQLGRIDVTLAGALPDLLAELANPRLSLLSRHPLPFTDPSGQASAHIVVGLPLDNALPIDAVALSAEVRMAQVHLGGLAAGMSLDRATLAVSATTHGLSLTGDGALGDIDSHLRYMMDFDAGGPEQVVEQAAVQAAPTPAALAAFGLDAGPALSGRSDLALDYQARRDGQSSIAVALDMTGLGIALPVWGKRPGQAAQAQATVQLDHGRLMSIDAIRAEGPELSVAGSIAMPATGPRRLQVQHFRIGRSRGDGTILLPAAGSTAPVRIALQGPALDLSPVIDAPASNQAPDPARTGQKAGQKAGQEAGQEAGRKDGTKARGIGWIADLRFGRVWVGPHMSLREASAHLENDGTRIERADIAARAPTPLSVRLAPDRDGRALSAHVDDAGLLLGALGLGDAVSGGAMRLDAHLADDTAPTTGSLEIGRFVIPDAPLAARIVRDLSVYGWLLSLPAPQLAVDRLVAPFSLAHGVLTLRDARAHTSALGVTLAGPVDLGRQTLDLRGTVVPAWLLNQLPGRLPLVGRLLSPETGGGVIAATLAIQGPLDDPKVHVNALSALAPGFLRRLFFE